MLTVRIFLVQILMASVLAVRCDDAAADRLLPTVEPPLPIIVSVPPNCLPDLERHPEGPPQYCVYVRGNKTVQNAGMLLVPNFIDTPDVSSNLIGLSQTPPVSMDLFIISNDSSSPVDMGLRGSGRTNFELSLPHGTKLDVELTFTILYQFKMLATHLCFIRMLVMFGDTLIGGDMAPIQGPSMILDPPLPIIAMSPPNCLEERAGRPNGPP
ncbi:hypothetical protein FOZ60_008058 [Perkinsus olseni]|uniref:Uncharacterized protein n=1 Tax=Perkinsus olseni TaxID=32597 RepID=A0A7J6PGG0_PEROL|nr:hypothetical protein FOZ60_008058 [Perkinsus olseni]